jgi:hypothetical protein
MDKERLKVKENFICSNCPFSQLWHVVISIPSKNCKLFIPLASAQEPQIFTFQPLFNITL